MKHNHDDTTLLAAIDAACAETVERFAFNSLALTSTLQEMRWSQESQARLRLLKSALARLPEPIQLNQLESWTLEERNAILQLATRQDMSPANVLKQALRTYQMARSETQPSLDWKDSSYKADFNRIDSAVLAADFGNSGLDQLKAAHAEGKAIQFQGTGGRWVDLDMGTNDPLFSAYPSSHYRIKPTPETFTAHGKEWTRHVSGDPMPCDGDVMVEYIMEGNLLSTKAWPAKTCEWGIGTSIIGWRYADEPAPAVAPPPPWTPAVGDVVKLKGGGPRMTVDVVYSLTECVWFDGSQRIRGSFHPATLVPVKEETK